MSADPFAPDAAAPPADPFAAAAEEAAAAPAPTPDASPEMPVVDREGEPVSVEPEPVVEAPADADAPLTPAEVPAAAEEAAPEAAPEAAVEAPVAPQEAEEQVEAAPEPQTATDGGQEPPQEPPVAPADAPGQPDAAAEEETGSKTRYYKLLYQSAPGQWTEKELPETGEHSEYVTRKSIGKNAKGDPNPVEPWMLARNNEHAKRIGFAIMGRPKEGVLLFPVPSGAWKPSMVKPAPPKPERERLEIS